MPDDGSIAKAAGLRRLGHVAWDTGRVAGPQAAVGMRGGPAGVLDLEAPIHDDAEPAARAFSAAALWTRPSCIQIAAAPRAIASSTTAGMNSGLRKMSTTSIGDVARDRGEVRVAGLAEGLGTAGLTGTTR